MAKQGWTIVRTSSQGADRHDATGRTSEAHHDPEVEGDLILGDLDPEDLASEHTAASSAPDAASGHAAKPKHGKVTDAIREDVDEIVKGTISCTPSLARPPLITP